MIGNQTIEKIWILSPLDKLLEQNKNQRNTFIALFERKEILLGLIKQGKIDSKKYKKIVIIAFKDTNSIVKSCAGEDILKLKDAKDPAIIDQWFREMIQNTGVNYDSQLSLYQKFKQLTEISNIRGTTVKEVQQSLLRNTEVKIKKSSLKQIQKPFFDYKEVVSFRAADKILEENEDNYEIYQNIFDRKAKIFSLIEKKELTPLKYKAYLETYLGKIKNEDILFQTKLEYQGLDLFHGGNVTTWFEEIYEEAKTSISEQKVKMAKLKRLSEIKQPEIPTKLQISSKNQAKGWSVPPKYPVSKNSGLNIKIIYSFKAIADLIENNKQDKQFLSFLEQRKKFLIHEYQTGVITALKYKNLIQNNLKISGISEAVIHSINLELSFLTDIHHENVEQWFKDIIAEVLIDLPERDFEKPSQSLQIPSRKAEGGLSNSRVNTLKTQSVVRIQVPSNVSSLDHSDFKDVSEIKAISNLKVIDMMLNLHKGNPEIYTSLFERKEQMFSQMKSGNIDAQAYQLLQEQELEKAKSGAAKNAVVLDLSKLKVNYNSNVNQWFQAVINQSGQNYEIQKEYYQRLKAQNTSSSPKKYPIGSLGLQSKPKKKQDSKYKILSFLKAMAVYESLLYYHKKNKIPYNNNKYLTQYEKIKKETYRFIQQIEQNKQLDVLNLVDELFPPINELIFYAGELDTYKAKTESIKSELKKEIATINEYTSFLKKQNNTQNFEIAKKQIAECESNFKYLSEWPHGTYQAFPKVQSQKVKKINIDVNKLQPNQIQISITSIGGLGSEHLLNIYFFQFNETKYSFTVNDGQVKNIKITQKLTENQISTVMKAQKSFIAFKLFKKSFFGGLNLVAQETISPRFTRVNTVQQKAKLQNIQIGYIAKVQKPKSPIEKEIVHWKITRFPAYHHSTFVEEELIKKYLPYTNPSPSEIES